MAYEIWICISDLFYIFEYACNWYEVSYASYEYCTLSEDVVYSFSVDSWDE